MNELLEALRRLQEIQQHLTELRQEEGKRERQVRIHGRNITKCQERIDGRRADLRSHQLEYDRVDLDGKICEANMAKHREALNKARTNREYTLILTTINSEKVDSAKLDGRLEATLLRMDAIRTEIAKDEQELAVHQQRLAEADRQLRDYLDQTGEQRTTLESQRSSVAEGVPSHALGLFERSAERHDGQAMAPIVRLHPKRDDYSCGGCNMKVTLEAINLLRTRDEVQTCHVCGRLLYLEPSASGPGR